MTWFFTILSLFGSYLNCKKKKICFILWIICNVFWLLFDLKASVYSRVILDLVQTGFSIYGLMEWSKNGN